MRSNKVISLIMIGSFMLTTNLFLGYVFFTDSIMTKSVFMVLIMLALLLVLMLLIQKYWDTHQRYKKQDYLLESVRDVLRRITEIQNVHEFKSKILTKIMISLNVFGIALTVRTNEESVHIVTGAYKYEEIENATIRDGGIQISDHYSVSLYVDTKINGFPFSEEEIRTITFIYNYFVMAFQNLELQRVVGERLDHLLLEMNETDNYDDFFWLQRSVFELIEKDRKRIARDLHDSVLQDNYFLMMKIRQDLQQITTPDIGNIQSLFGDYLERIEYINHELRQICFTVYPQVLEELGLISAVKTFLEGSQSGKNVNVDIEIIGAEAVQFDQLTNETKQHLYRIIQELWNNTQKHAQASNVTVRFAGDEDNLYLTFKDNGIGLSSVNSENESTLLLRKGAGLRQIRNRLVDIGAKWNITSSHNNGMEILITISI
jgi:two-component system sensor histidine kinase ComP